LISEKKIKKEVSRYETPTLIERQQLRREKEAAPCQDYTANDTKKPAPSLQKVF
jgi:hypothetical protein